MTGRIDLTIAQGRVLDFVVRFVERTGKFPTASEVARGLAFSSLNAVYEQFKRLEDKGYLDPTKESGWRRYALTERATEDGERYPLFGRIPAGPTWYAEDVDVEWISGLDDLFPSAQSGDYFVTVDGDSMIDAGLEPGMLILMRPNIPPRPRDICAVWVEGSGGTLKRVVPDGEFIRLVPENPDYEEQLWEAEQVIIQGVLQAALSITHFH